MWSPAAKRADRDEVLQRILFLCGVRSSARTVSIIVSPRVIRSDSLNNVARSKFPKAHSFPHSPKTSLIISRLKRRFGWKRRSPVGNNK